MSSAHFKFDIYSISIERTSLHYSTIDINNLKEIAVPRGFFFCVPLKGVLVNGSSFNVQIDIPISSSIYI